MSDDPKTLKPYLFHGVDLNHGEGEPEAIGDCPWCGRDDKFSVNVETGQWRCFVCAEGSEAGGGNVYTFIRRLHDMSVEATDVKDLNALAVDRKFISAESLVHWGVCKSVLSGEWLVPGYNKDGKLTGLYKYARDAGRDSGTNLFPTPTLGHHIHGMNLLNLKAETIYVAEGWSDGIALWEMLRGYKYTEEGYKQTASLEASVLAKASVLAIPGANSFKEEWAPIFEGKHVVLCGDNDHPRYNQKLQKLTPPGSLTGMERTTGIITGSATPPGAVSYLAWGDEPWENGGTYDKIRKSGYDLRDLFNA